MKTRHVAMGAGAVGAAVLVALLAAGPSSRPPAGHALRPDDADLVALGAKVYQAHCAVCHGARLEGQANWRERGADGVLPAPPHDETGHTWHHPDEVLFRLTKHGVAQVANMPNYKSAMPAYENVLSDREIVAVLSWIKAQWPPDVRRLQEQVNEQYVNSRRD